MIKSLGGDTGWLYADTLWKIRGLLDLLVGGIADILPALVADR